MKAKLDAGKYRSPASFQADLKLICDNCVTFNPEDSIYYQEAEKLRKYAEEQYKTWLPKIDPTADTADEKGKTKHKGSKRKAEGEEKKVTPDDEAAAAREASTPRKKRKRKSKQGNEGTAEEATADTLIMPTPSATTIHTKSRKTDAKSKRKSSSPNLPLAFAGGPTDLSGASSTVVPAESVAGRRRVGRPRGQRWKNEASAPTASDMRSPVGTTTLSPSLSASGGREAASYGTSTVNVSARMSIAESASPALPKPAGHSTRYLAWLASRQQPKQASPYVGSEIQIALSALSGTERDCLARHLDSLLRVGADRQEAWSREEAVVAPVGAQNLLEENVEQLCRIQMSQYEGMTMADIARAASVGSGLAALAALVPPRQVLASSWKDRSRVIAPLMPLAARGQVLNPLAPPTITSSYHQQQQHPYSYRGL